MDEFVKRLYDFMGIYRIFWSQNRHYRYLLIFYRYLQIFFDILSIFFFKNFSTSARAPQSRFFDGNRYFPIFPSIDFSSVFSSRCRMKTDFSEIYRPKKMIFCSLIISKV